MAIQAAQSRVYAVFEDGEKMALVRARSQSEAIRHHTANRFSAIVADQATLIEMLGDGVRVEDATASAPEPTAGAAQE